MASVDEIRNAKQSSAKRAIDDYIIDDMVVGIGSGSTIVFAVVYLADKIQNQRLKNITCIPTSYQSLLLIKKYKLKLGDLTDHPVIDVTIDGADEVEEGTLQLIKGGGGCHLQEKIIAQNSKKLVIIVDETKLSPKLGTKFMVPVEVIPFALEPIKKRLQALDCKEIRLRESNGCKAGPAVTDNGYFILDVMFEGGISDPSQVETKINQIAGVIAVGIFANLTYVVIVGKFDGTVLTLNAK